MSAQRPRKIQPFIPRPGLFHGLVLVVLSITACASLPLTSVDDVCSIFRAKKNWHQTALGMQEKWNIPLHVPMAIMYQESKFRRKAKPPRKYLLGIIPWKRRSSAFGYAQAVDGTWQAYVDSTGNRFARRTNFDDALDFMGWYMNKSASIASIDLDDTYRQYLAYHEGWTGFKKRSYENKAWLKQVASNVDQLSDRYAVQYQGCANDLENGFLRGLF